MKTLPTGARAVLFATATLLLVGAPVRAGVVRTLSGTYPIERAESVVLEYPYGDLSIEPSKDQSVHATLDVRCPHGHEDCEETAQDLEVAGRIEAGVLRIKLEGLPKLMSRGLSLEGRIQVPPGVPLEIEMGVGDLAVRGHASDLDLKLGVGDVTVSLERRVVGTVKLSVGVGDARLRGADGRIESEGWLGHVVRWSEGPGKSRVRVATGVGDVSVTLR